MADTPVDAATLYDEKQQDSSPSTSGIDVVRAENEFHALSRSLSKHSGASKRQLSTITIASQDVEKANGDEAEQFDLGEYLASSNDANQHAGIKHKVGVFACGCFFVQTGSCDSMLEWCGRIYKSM
jgi:ATP-binding cassette, subfamily G (WHITE), member 2, SNQ2